MAVGASNFPYVGQTAPPDHLTRLQAYQQLPRNDRPEQVADGCFGGIADSHQWRYRVCPLRKVVS